MARKLVLPQADGSLQTYTAGPASHYASTAPIAHSRVAYAAAHVVLDTQSAQPNQIDWEATLAYRHHLWSLGLAVAEAMDTSQRSMGLDWPAASELMQRSLAAAKTHPGARIACGAGTDQLVFSADTTIEDIKHAYEEQCRFIEDAGGRIILMASRVLAARAQTPEDYMHVYDHILSQVAHPVIIHWLGAMFDPALTGYWGSHDLDIAMENCLAILQRHATKIDGIKISLLDAEREIAMRRRLPAGIKMYTGDDFNYADLMLGDGQDYSHALLGIFDAIAPAAAAALQQLDAGNIERYTTILEPTVPLSRHIFQAPTFNYKAGIVFLAYLNGHQEHFKMIGGLEKARSIQHLAQLFVLADQAHLLVDPDLASARMQATLVEAGITQEGAPF
ncbi:dihydrodipicolinate synthase family protein [Dictyobacter alpinus]